MLLNDNNLIWIDLEMTGLNPEKNCIIEIATLITNTDLTILAEGPTLAIYQSEFQLSLMDNWNINIHTASGLINRVQKSNINEMIAERETLDFLSKWVPAGKSPMCGNSIYQDRRFLFRYMPTLEAYFNYRCLDISTLKELAQRWKPSILKGIKKRNVHQALEDIHDSVKELAYYRKYFLLNLL